MQYENGFVFADVNILYTPSGRVAKNILDSSNMNLYASPVCMKDNDTGEVPTAFVVLRDKSYDEEKARKAIDEYQNHILPERDKAVDIRFIDELPLTPVGKVDKNKLKDIGGVSEVDFDTLIDQKKKNIKVKKR